MSLLFFVDGGFQNGVGALLVDQAKAIHKQYKDIHVAVSSKEGEPNLINSLIDKNIPLIYLDGLENHENFKKHLKSLSQYIIENDIKKIHVQTNWQLILIYLLKLQLLFKSNFKIIYTIHAFRNNEPQKEFLARTIISFLLLFCTNKIICTSTFIKNKFYILNYKMKLIPLGVSDNFFEDTYKEPSISYLSLVFPAQFRVGKRQDIIITAFSEYVKDTGDKNSTLVLPGDGPLLESMKTLSKKLQIDNQVFFPGQCDKDIIKSYYLKSNIGVISSNSETFGLCILEPFVLGRCIITRHVGIANDIIKNNINGFFFDNVTDLKEILINLSLSKETIKTIGLNNFNERNSFHWDKISKEYLSFLDKF